MTIVPWECGRCAVWDFTCPDTLAPSYRSAAASDPGAVAALAESRKMSKYSALDSTLYRFFLLLSQLWVPLGPDHSVSSKILGDQLPYTQEIHWQPVILFNVSRLPFSRVTLLQFCYLTDFFVSFF